MPRGAFKRGAWQRLPQFLISVMPYYTINYTHPTTINVVPRGSKKTYQSAQDLCMAPRKNEKGPAAQLWER